MARTRTHTHAQAPLPPTATQREADEAPLNRVMSKGRVEEKLKSAGAERFLLDFKVWGIGGSVCMNVCVAAKVWG